MAQIGWGKNRHAVRNISASGSWRELPTPVEESFELTTEKGDKQEAKLEGGAIKDIRYKQNTNAISFDVFVAKGEKKPFADVNGVVSDEFEYVSQPEDPAVPAGIYVHRARISCEVKSNDSEGMKLTYTVEPLAPASEATPPMEIGVVTFTESNGSITAVAFTALEAVSEPS